MATTEKTIQERLSELYQLQLIDSQLDEIQVLKGELPMEVLDLEDEIEGLQIRISKLEDSKTDLQDSIAQHQAKIKESENLIAKYGRQLDDVKNNREYEALTKEIELQRLDIQLSEKRIREVEVSVGAKDETLQAAKDKMAEKNKNLETKKVELDKIIAKTEKEGSKLQKQSEAHRKSIEERLLKAYDRVRSSYRNGLAVVTVERDACGGCFNKIPPQLQLEISMQKRIIPCEHCGRILVDTAIVEKVEA
jgi:predicted  nucleic acid-binding Zn-ribbon protein